MEASFSYLEFHSFTRFLWKLSAAYKSKQAFNVLGYGDEQCFHILGILDEVILRHNVDQGTNGKVSPVLWT